MKILFLASIIGLTCISANAEDIKKVVVNCDTINLYVGHSSGQEFYANATWEEPAAFPNPTKKLSVGSQSRYTQEGFEFECPQLYVKYDKNKLTVKANTVEDALDVLTSKYDRYFDLYFYGWYTYPSIREGYNSTSYSINLYDYSLKSGYKRVGEGQDVKGYDFRDIDSDVVIGYKVDGGKLKPVLYDQKVSWYTGDMADANIIDIYHKHDDKGFKIDEKVQRIHMDKSKGLVEIYRKYPFPTS